MGEEDNYSIDKYTYLMKVICFHLGGGACQKSFENLSTLPSWSMREDSKIKTDDSLWYKFNLQKKNFDNYEKRKDLMNKNAEVYLDYLFSISHVRSQVIQIAGILNEKSQLNDDKRVYLKDIKHIFEITKTHNE